jgi:hypothetical protein
MNIRGHFCFPPFLSFTLRSHLAARIEDFPTKNHLRLKNNIHRRSRRRRIAFTKAMME